MCGGHFWNSWLRHSPSTSPARWEVLARLLRLNHERNEEEVRQSLHDKGKKVAGGEGKGAPAGKRGRKKKKGGALSNGEPQQGSLF